MQKTKAQLQAEIASLIEETRKLRAQLAEEHARANQNERERNAAQAQVSKDSDERVRRERRYTDEKLELCYAHGKTLARYQAAIEAICHSHFGQSANRYAQEIPFPEPMPDGGRGPFYQSLCHLYDLTND
jgi:chromosome segregation ATPase